MIGSEFSTDGHLVVLDTHVWIWFVLGEKSLGKRAREVIIKASRGSSLVLAGISIWEAAMLESKGRLVITKDTHIWMDEALAIPGLRVQPLTAAIAVDSTRLPDGFHPDPADRIIVATARHVDATIITADSSILNYAESKHVKCMKA